MRCRIEALLACPAATGRGTEVLALFLSDDVQTCVDRLTAMAEAGQ